MKGLSWTVGIVGCAQRLTDERYIMLRKSSGLEYRLTITQPHTLHSSLTIVGYQSTFGYCFNYLLAWFQPLPILPLPRKIVPFVISCAIQGT